MPDLQQLVRHPFCLESRRPLAGSRKPEILTEPQIMICQIFQDLRIQGSVRIWGAVPICQELETYQRTADNPPHAAALDRKAQLEVVGPLPRNATFPPPLEQQLHGGVVSRGPDWRDNGDS